MKKNFTIAIRWLDNFLDEPLLFRGEYIFLLQLVHRRATWPICSILRHHWSFILFLFLFNVSVNIIFEHVEFLSHLGSVMHLVRHFPIQIFHFFLEFLCFKLSQFLAICVIFLSSLQEFRHLLWNLRFAFALLFHLRWWSHFWVLILLSELVSLSFGNSIDSTQVLWSLGRWWLIWRLGFGFFSEFLQITWLTASRYHVISLG